MDLVDAALSLVRGVPFADSVGSAFIAAEVKRLEAAETQARELRLEIQLALGRHAEVIDGARDLLERQPYRETLWELYGRGLALSGRATTASAAIDGIRARLRDRFGVELHPSLADLHAVIQRHLGTGDLARLPPRGTHDAGTARHARSDGCIPQTRGRLIGREQLLPMLCELLESERLVTLVGPTGVGKTRLAVDAVSTTGMARIPIWCALDGARTAGHIIGEIAAATDTRASGPIGAYHAVLDVLASKRVLLILDTCDRVIEDAAKIVNRLLAACPELSIMATSTEPLHLDLERLVEVHPLAVDARSDAIPPDPAAAAATELLWTRCVEAGGSPHPTRRVAAEFARLAALAEGYPLAIELIAPRLAAEGLRVGADLEPGALDLDAFDGTEDPLGHSRHATMRQAIEWSYSTSSVEGQAVLETLAGVEEPMTYSTAAAALRASGRSTRSLISALAALVDSSLLQVSLTRGRTCYRMSAAVRALALERHRAGPRRQRSASAPTRPLGVGPTRGRGLPHAAVAALVPGQHLDPDPARKM